MAPFWKNAPTSLPHQTHLLDRLLNQAISAGASDLHINCTKTGASPQLRVHGHLSPLEDLDLPSYRTLCALIKLHGHMDVSTFTRPQDGRLTLERHGGSVDVRIFSLPTVFGEDFVCRFFNTQANRLGLEELGMAKPVLSTCKTLLGLESGLILVTGPTGSGKTTTLYSFLEYLLRERAMMIVTLEDPVESVLTGIRQSQINPRSGHDFVTGLRAVLRQDPDAIMIGEIRDKETALTALDAAYTGHLVLSSLHTDHCLSTVGRLLSFDLDPFYWLLVSRVFCPSACSPSLARSVKKRDVGRVRAEVLRAERF